MTQQKDEEQEAALAQKAAEIAQREAQLRLKLAPELEEAQAVVSALDSELTEQSAVLEELHRQREALPTSSDTPQAIVWLSSVFMSGGGNA